MKFNPFLIDTQGTGEDRVTYALAVLMEQGGAELLVSLLQELGLSVRVEASQRLKIDLQIVAATTRPDAVFEIPGRLLVLFENKIVKGTLRNDQIQGHLALAGTSPGAQHVLLAITPDRAPPGWWEQQRVQHQGVDFVYGSWETVVGWAKRLAEKDSEEPDHLRFLLRSFVHYLVQLGVVNLASTKFDPERVKRLQESAAQWRADFLQQHEAQEALLSEVASAFAAELGPRGVSTPEFDVASRWWEKGCPFPISSRLKIRWQDLGLKDWRRPPLLWAEICYRPPTSASGDSGYWLRSGIVLEGTEEVGTWYGPIYEAARDVFVLKPHAWKDRTRAGDVLIERPFDPTQPEKMKRQLVDDLLVWILRVLPGLVKHAVP